MFKGYHHILSVKEEAIKLYEEGRSLYFIGRHLGIRCGLISEWINTYKALGCISLRPKRYTKHSLELKLSLVREVLEHGLSCEKVALSNGVSPSTLKSWVGKKRKEGYDTLATKKPRELKEKDMARKEKAILNDLDKLKEELERLRTELALLKKVKALVQEREARDRRIGQKPSKN